MTHNKDNYTVLVHKNTKKVVIIWLQIHIKSVIRSYYHVVHCKLWSWMFGMEIMSYISKKKVRIGVKLLWPWRSDTFLKGSSLNHKETYFNGLFGSECKKSFRKVQVTSIRWVSTKTRDLTQKMRLIAW